MRLRGKKLKSDLTERAPLISEQPIIKTKTIVDLINKKVFRRKVENPSMETSFRSIKRPKKPVRLRKIKRSEENIRPGRYHKKLL